MMLNEMSRSKWIGMWFGAVAVAIVSSVLLGATTSLQAVALLLLVSVVPPAILLIVWHGAPPATVAELLYSVEHEKSGRS